MLGASYPQAAGFKLGIMEAKKGEAEKYAPLVDYFKAHGFHIELVPFSSYPDAATKFVKGEIEAMFAGSGVAGIMIMKKLAFPIVRPVSQDKWSTYWAVIIAKKGSPKFTGDKSFFKGKRIICCALASSGEFFARSILGTNRKLIKAVSHGDAITSLANGKADIAIVKNRVWDSMKNQYPNFELVGEDTGENPNGTLIMSQNINPHILRQIQLLLSKMGKDDSPPTLKVKNKLKITEYIRTTTEDFDHTIALLKKAGVTKDFNFAY